METVRLWPGAKLLNCGKLSKRWSVNDNATCSSGPVLPSFRLKSGDWNIAAWSEVSSVKANRTNNSNRTLHPSHLHNMSSQTAKLPVYS